jgi:hypothetical protein
MCLSAVHITRLSKSQTCVALNEKGMVVNSELERIWKRMDVAKFKVLSRHFLGDTASARKNAGISRQTLYWSHRTRSQGFSLLTTVWMRAQLVSVKLLEFTTTLQVRALSYLRILIQILYFWTLSIVLFLFKTQRFGVEFCLRLQVKPTKLDPTERASPDLRNVMF